MKEEKYGWAEKLVLFFLCYVCFTLFFVACYLLWPEKKEEPAAVVDDTPTQEEIIAEQKRVLQEKIKALENSKENKAITYISDHSSEYTFYVHSDGNKFNKPADKYYFYMIDEDDSISFVAYLKSVKYSDTMTSRTVDTVLEQYFNEDGTPLSGYRLLSGNELYDIYQYLHYETTSLGLDRSSVIVEINRTLADTDFESIYYIEDYRNQTLVDRFRATDTADIAYFFNTLADPDVSYVIWQSGKEELIFRHTDNGWKTKDGLALSSLVASPSSYLVPPEPKKPVESKKPSKITDGCTLDEFLEMYDVDFDSDEEAEEWYDDYGCEAPY